MKSNPQSQHWSTGTSDGSGCGRADKKPRFHEVENVPPSGGGPGKVEFFEGRVHQTNRHSAVTTFDVFGGLGVFGGEEQVFGARVLDELAQ